MTWRPIATADPVEYIDQVILCREGKPNSALPCFWDGDKWRAFSLVGTLEYIAPTHWMPLPEPPQ